MTRQIHSKTWFIICGVVSIFFAGCSPKNAREVVVYTSQDDVYARPILDEFTRRTGYAVRALYDSEAVKTVGLANRLQLERANPECDIFWNNEEFRTRLLDAEGLFDATTRWALLGHRSRRIVVNTNLVTRLHYPASLDELTNSVWRGHVALAYPMFGTTSTYFMALRQAWGAARWKAWCMNLAANKPFLVDGNSVAVKFVSDGQAWVGLTDSDDIRAAQKDNAPVVALPIGGETLLIHNTVGMIAQAPHPEAARLLFEFLRSPVVVRSLVAADALEAEKDESAGKTLSVEWSLLIKDVELATKEIDAIFLRDNK